MNFFSIIFAIVILSLFWGGFVYMLFYSLKLKSHEAQESEDKEQK
jgi:hypothetical protein